MLKFEKKFLRTFTRKSHLMSLKCSEPLSSVWGQARHKYSEMEITSSNPSGTSLPAGMT